MADITNPEPDTIVMVLTIEEARCVDRALECARRCGLGDLDLEDKLWRVLQNVD